MHEGSERHGELTPEQALLREGCQSYLDAIHAINAFQTRVCHGAQEIINNAYDRISTIARLAKPLEIAANIFVYPVGADSQFDGSEAWIGASIWLDRPVWAQLYLALAFARNPHSDQQTVHACFALEAGQKYILAQLGKIFVKHEDCKIYNDWDWLAVELRRPLGNALRVQEELAKVLDDALTWWNNNSHNATANSASA